MISLKAEVGKVHQKESVQTLITCKVISHFLTGIQNTQLGETSCFAFSLSGSSLMLFDRL